MKNLILKSIVLFTFIVLIVSVLDTFFIIKEQDFSNTMNEFNSIDKDSIDILFFGSSHSFSTFNPEVIDNKLGTLSFNLGSAGQRLTVTNYLLEDILEKMHPKLIVLDVFPTSLGKPNDDRTKGLQLNVFDNTSFSIKKLKKIHEIYKFDEFPSVISKTVRNHKEWMNIKFNSKKKNNPNRIDIRGFVGSLKTINKKEREKFKDYLSKDYKLINVPNSLYGLNKEERDFLIQFLEITKLKNIKTIIVSAPYIQSQFSTKFVDFESSISYLADSLNIDYLTYNDKFKELNLTFDDYRDAGHVNVSGSKKVTTYFANYLADMGLFEIKNDSILKSDSYNISDQKNQLEDLNFESPILSQIISANIVLKSNFEFSSDLSVKEMYFHSDDNNRYIVLKFDDNIKQDRFDKLSFGIQAKVYQSDYGLRPKWLKDKNSDVLTFKTKPKIIKEDKQTFVLLTLKKKCTIDKFKSIRIFLQNEKKFQGIIGNAIKVKDISFK